MMTANEFPKYRDELADWTAEDWERLWKIVEEAGKIPLDGTEATVP